MNLDRILALLFFMLGGCVVSIYYEDFHTSSATTEDVSAACALQNEVKR